MTQPQTCTSCLAEFEHHPEDLEAYQSFGMPPPLICPTCRHQQRCTFRNEHVLYRNPCDLCGKPTVSIYAHPSPFPVFCAACWHGDGWDALQYGRAFDFSRPFFEQFVELRNQVPRLALNNLTHENSEYCNQAIGNRNCYLSFTAQDNQDCMFGFDIRRCVDVYNCSFLNACTLCFDSLECIDCYQCINSQHLRNCSECLFCFDLIGCQSCFACAGLRNARFCFENQQLSAAEYQARVAAQSLGSALAYERWKASFTEVRKRIPHKYAFLLKTENCSGDCISDSKNVRESFQVYDSEQCAYCYNMRQRIFNLRDVSYAAEARHGFQSTSIVGESAYFSNNTWYSSNVWYSDLCYNCEYLFGSVGLQRQKHCLLNRPYSASEYEELRARISEHMRGTGEWGMFFPVASSPFSYNETVAYDFAPLTKEQTLTRGWRWKDADPRESAPATAELPDRIEEAGDNLTNEIFACRRCRKNYRVLLPELRRYRFANVPIPRLCPTCRYLERYSLKNPQRLFARRCAHCLVELESPYAPERPEQILCEECYQQALGGSGS